MLRCTLHKILDTMIKGATHLNKAHSVLVANTKVIVSSFAVPNRAKKR
jgi:hypothetical protein